MGLLKCFPLCLSCRCPAHSSCYRRLCLNPPQHQQDEVCVSVNCEGSLGSHCQRRKKHHRTLKRLNPNREQVNMIQAVFVFNMKADQRAGGSQHLISSDRRTSVHSCLSSIASSKHFHCPAADNPSSHWTRVSVSISVQLGGHSLPVHMSDHRMALLPFSTLTT